MKALLLLADGSIWEGKSFGATGEKAGRVIFNTGMIGYEEFLSDPSSDRQIQVMTYPLIGSYGLAEEALMSRHLWASGLVAREYSESPKTRSLSQYLRQEGVIALQGVDTREIVLHLRRHGEMPGIITTETLEKQTLKNKLQASISALESREAHPGFPFEDNDTSPPPAATPRLIIIDLGMRRDFLKQFSLQPFPLQVLKAEDFSRVSELQPAGLILAGGPEAYSLRSPFVQETEKLLGKFPILGVGSGNLLLGAALGGRISRLQQGHHGLNIPVRHADGQLLTSSQNHSFVLEEGWDTSTRTTWRNLIDHSIEGIESKPYLARGYQFILRPVEGHVHPLLQDFLNLVLAHQKGASGNA